MVRPIAFAVEQWMDKYENTPGVLNVAETCASSISLNELINLSKDKNTTLPVSGSTKLTYGSIRGSAELRGTVASLHSHGKQQLTEENVIIAQGGISANFLALYTLLGPTDHAICVYPTYQQLYSVPESLGATVSLWKLREENGYIPDPKELDDLVRPNTKMIILNNPNNPTGALIPSETLSQIVQFAKDRGIILMSDEVYRPLFHSALESTADLPPPITSFGYEKTIVTGSMSKAWALAGIRIGWVVSPDEAILTSLAHARDYTTISVSQVDDQIATYALSPAVRDGLLERNVKLALHNLGLVKAFVEKYSKQCKWVCPNAGTTAFIQFNKGGKPVNDVSFCQDVIGKTKVFFTPGSHCFGLDEDFPGYIRLGYVCETTVLEEALEKLGRYIEEAL